MSRFLSILVALLVSSPIPAHAYSVGLSRAVAVCSACLEEEDVLQARAADGDSDARYCLTIQAERPWDPPVDDAVIEALARSGSRCAAVRLSAERLFLGTGNDDDRSVLVEAGELGHVGAQLGLAYEHTREDRMSEAVFWFERAAEQGSPLALNRLMVLFAVGRDVPRDLGRAREYYLRLPVENRVALWPAETVHLVNDPIARLGAGDRQARDLLSNWIVATLSTELTRPGMRADLMALNRQAAEAGDPAAQTWLGALYARGGDGFGADAVESLRWYDLAAEQGHRVAAERLFAELETKTVPELRELADLGLRAAPYWLGTRHRDEDRTFAESLQDSVELLEQAAEQGHVRAQAALANLFVKIHGMSEDDEDLRRSFYWTERAASNNHGRGVYQLGVLYWHGAGVSQDHAEAVRLWCPHLRLGDWFVEEMYGRAFASGRGVPEDLYLAEYWFRRAAAGGSVAAKNELGRIFARRDDYEEADRFWKVAAQEGDRDAQINLALSYATGRGGEKNPEAALGWVLLVGETKLVWWEEFVAHVESQLDPPAIGRARSWAEAWQPDEVEPDSERSDIPAFLTDEELQNCDPLTMHLPGPHAEAPEREPELGPLNFREL